MRALWLMGVVALPLLLAGCETDGTDAAYGGASSYSGPDYADQAQAAQDRENEQSLNDETSQFEQNNDREMMEDETP